jgi:hypothetical protein
MLLIYSTEVTNRLKYISELAFGELLGVRYRLTADPEEFRGYPGPKINYSAADTGEGLFIRSAGLLFENVVKLQDVQPWQMDSGNVIFGHGDAGSALPFDPFAASFYLVTRYEEYHSYESDKYGRFKFTDSISYRAGFLHEPVVNHWMLRLLEIIRKRYPEIEYRLQQYKFVPTIDIDHAFAYGHRKLYRILGSYWRDILKNNWDEAVSRTEVLLHRKPDPYDNYDFLDEVHRKYSVKPLFFVLFADYGGNDNNVTITAKAFHALLRRLDAQGTVGIHPSLSSNKHFSKLNTEIIRLSHVLDRDVNISRQHFLKINLPKTYRHLLDLGITDDYSMGYAGTVGFRAGIANDFPFFDLFTNNATTLRVHPVSVMDVTLRDHSRLDTAESLVKIRQTIDKVRSVNGTFVSLWHNESLSGLGRWKGWREVYQEMVEAAVL